eukprot:scaffold1068_cov375-Prasinococcus_capsulatus_cf.AAC.21
MSGSADARRRAGGVRKARPLSPARAIGASVQSARAGGRLRAEGISPRSRWVGPERDQSPGVAETAADTMLDINLFRP